MEEYLVADSSKRRTKKKKKKRATDGECLSCGGGGGGGAGEVHGEHEKNLQTNTMIFHKYFFIKLQ